MAGVIYFAAASPGVLGGEDVVHGDGFVCPLVGSGVDLGLSNSGLKFGATTACMADSRPTAGTTWNRLVGLLHMIPGKKSVTVGPEGLD